MDIGCDVSRGDEEEGKVQLIPESAVRNNTESIES